jgi:hypothetical protein
MKTQGLPLREEKIKLSDPSFKSAGNVVNAIMGSLEVANGAVSQWAVRYLLKHLDRGALIRLYNDACSHDYGTIKKGIEDHEKGVDEPKRQDGGHPSDVDEVGESVMSMLLGEEEHEHRFGPFERSRLAGTPHRKCTVPGCKAVSLDDEDYPASEREEDAAEADYEGRQEDRRVTDESLLGEAGGLKVFMLEVDWKDNFSSKEINQTRREVGGEGLTYDYVQDNVDAKIMFVSSAPLTDEQMDQLWHEGDLATGDQLWVGKDFDDVLRQVKAHADKLASEDEE